MLVLRLFYLSEEKGFYTPTEYMEDAANSMIKDFFPFKKKKAIPVISLFSHEDQS